MEPAGEITRPDDKGRTLRVAGLCLLAVGIQFTYGIARLFDFATMASLLKTSLSIVIVVVGTGVFVGVAIVLGSLLHDWLYGRTPRAQQPEDDPSVLA